MSFTAKATKKTLAPERLALYEKWKLTGQSKAAFCREEQLNPREFYYWTNYYEQSIRPRPERPTLLPAQATISASSPAIISERHIEIILSNDIKLRLPLPSQTQSIIELIRGLSCN